MAPLFTVRLSQEQAAAVHFLCSILVLLFFISITPWLTRWLRPSQPTLEKKTTYESGIAPTGDAQNPINSRLYGIGCIAILFELEAILLLPWALVWQNTTSLPAQQVTPYRFYMTLAGTGMILLWATGLIYLLTKSPYPWFTTIKPKEPNLAQGPVPQHYYEKINAQYATSTLNPMPTPT